MATPEEIQSQQERLQIARKVLAFYLQQLALFGTAYAPPSLFTSIREARSHIHQTKKQLRLWNIEVEDQLDDEAQEFELPLTKQASRTPSAQSFIAQLGAELRNDPDTKAHQSRTVKLDFLAIREKALTIDTLGLV